MKSFFIIFSKIFFNFFYKKEFLQGRWFSDSIDGYKWCWKNFFSQKILGYNRKIPWTTSPHCIIGNYKNIQFDINDLNNFQHFGCYFQNYNAVIKLGKGTYIAPNVGIITENHDLYDLNKHQPAKDVVIGKNCWVGMNSVILPGVILGDRTIVGAGSIVTKSFTEGNCVVVGNPARKIKTINSELL